MPTQIFNIVNSVVSQAMGSTAITAVDNTGLVAMGNTILSSSTNTEAFLNTLVQRIGRTIISYRRYKSQFDDLVLSDMEYGNIVQKIKVSMPVAESDESYGLTNGTSVDMFKVRKPVTSQKFFTTETPYQLVVTVQRVHLKDAFTSGDAMERFISAIFGEVQNKIELSLETLARNAINNMIAEKVKANKVINLATAYTGTISGDAFSDPDFLRYAIGQIKLYSRRMTSMSTLYNDGSETRHTPKEYQKLYVLADFETAAETVVQYAAFNDEFVRLDGYKEVPYWQSAQTPDTINVTPASGGSAVTQGSIVAVLFDRDALGVYKREEWTSTTPFNSAGGYANTFWHMRDIWFNDMSENFIVFTAVVGG